MFLTHLCHPAAKKLIFLSSLATDRLRERKAVEGGCTMLFSFRRTFKGHVSTLKQFGLSRNCHDELPEKSFPTPASIHFPSNMDRDFLPM
ncbi:hypothetical protein CDAR_390851 [Caerostris darwini]|uniref:Uncharacterized protein n=1 Tax=Caerostris darwini TaxID=1538125 RepID=A0AAV4TA56_9ARAC|nr:hypothetical protein CDAR_390851 [Caerostris darwini]